MSEFKILEMKLRNRSLSEQRTLRFEILEHEVAQLWAARLQLDLERGSRAVKNFFFHGWPIERRSLAFLLAEMNRHIGVINSFFHRHAELPYSIDLEFSPALLNRDSLNQIHHHFERLIGQRWNYSPYYLKADRTTRFSILQINYLCHELEPLLGGPQGWDGNYQSHVVCSWASPALVPMKPEHFANFSPRLQWGDVYLHYAQLGKDHIEAFCDGDESIADENISGIQYLSGEFDICFRTNTFTGGAALDKWLRQKKLNPQDKTLGVGYCAVAKIEGGERTGEDLSQFMDGIYRMDELEEIRLISDQAAISRSFADYDWDDADYESVMAAAYEEPVNLARPDLGALEGQADRGSLAELTP